MTANGKLKILVVVFFCFIVILVGMLIYAISLSKENNASTGASATTTQAAATASAKVETMDLKLYYFDADDYEKEKEVRTVTIDKKLYQEDLTGAINKLLEGTDLQIQKAVVDGNSITIDLSKAEAQKFNAGSASGITRTNILAATLVNLPDISEMKVTVDGEKGVAGDHYNFNGVFTKASNGKYYDFTIAQ